MHDFHFIPHLNLLTLFSIQRQAYILDAPGADPGFFLGGGAPLTDR